MTAANNRAVLSTQIILAIIDGPGLYKSKHATIFRTGSPTTPFAICYEGVHGGVELYDKLTDAVGDYVELATKYNWE